MLGVLSTKNPFTREEGVFLDESESLKTSNLKYLLKPKLLLLCFNASIA